MKNMPKAINEMFRVCKKGGLVVISDLHARGRREYEHAPDKRFLLDVERQLKKYAKSIRKAKTDMNEMFVCEKE